MLAVDGGYTVIIQMLAEPVEFEDGGSIIRGA